MAYDKAARKHRKDLPPNFGSVAAGAGAAAAAAAKHAGQAAPPPPAAPPRPASGFYGVRASGKRWYASISYGGNEHYLGIFDTKEQAAALGAYFEERAC